MSETQRSIKVGIFVFIGSLFGSLLGVAADFSGIMETVDTVKRFFYPTVEVVGSDTILGESLGMFDAWKTGFEDENEIKVKADPIGSTNGVKKVVAGEKVDILAMSAPMNDEDYQKITGSGVEVSCAAVIGFDVIIFVTGLDSSAQGLLLDPVDIHKILDGRLKNWGQLGGEDHPISVLARPGSGTTRLVLNTFLQDGKPHDDSHYKECNSNEECLNKALEMGGGFLWVSASWLHTQPEYFRVVPIKTAFNQNGETPFEDKARILGYITELVRPLYFYVLKHSATTEDSLNQAKDFLHYVRGVKGQEILEQNNFFTFFRRPKNVQVDLPPEFAKLAEQDKICK